MTTPLDAVPSPQLSDLVRGVHRGYPSGLTIVTTLDGGQPFGMAVSAFSSVSLEPPTVMVCVQMSSSNHARFYAAEVLGVNVVSTSQAEEARQFARPGVDKFAGIPWHEGAHGAPILDNAAGFFEVAIQERILAYTHTIFMGRVLDAGVQPDAHPLIYVNGRFHDGSDMTDLEQQETRR